MVISCIHLWLGAEEGEGLDSDSRRTKAQYETCEICIILNCESCKSTLVQELNTWGWKLA